MSVQFSYVALYTRFNNYLSWSNLSAAPGAFSCKHTANCRVASSQWIMQITVFLVIRILCRTTTRLLQLLGLVLQT